MLVEIRAFYKGEEVGIMAQPLSEYLLTRPIKEIIFDFASTACQRGYHGRWEVKNNKLYLVKFWASVDKKEVDINYFFPEQKEVFAYWFSGKISIPIGEILHYHKYLSIYEKDLVLSFKEGVLLGEEEIDNRTKFKKDKTAEKYETKPNKTFDNKKN
jgi:hypothetical protein